MDIPKKVNVSNILVLEEPPSTRFIPLPTLVESGKVASYSTYGEGKLTRQHSANTTFHDASIQFQAPFEMIIQSIKE
jgi:hypothetical protein